eukprot:Sspe_Gene.24385::Locus_9656_Transcript_1_1_Confidence_1.000_Length_590::g.24385::m.24385
MLSPGRRLFQGRSYGQKPTQEQLNLILDFVGHDPTGNDWVTTRNPKEWLRKQPARPPQDLRRLFPTASAAALDILRKMLSFNPNERASAGECLQHHYFGEYAWGEHDADEPYPLFDGSFTKKCTTSDEARKLVNLEITSYHPEFEKYPGVELPDDVSRATHVVDETTIQADEENVPSEDGAFD